VQFDALRVRGTSVSPLSGLSEWLAILFVICSVMICFRHCDYDRRVRPFLCVFRELPEKQNASFTRCRRILAAKKQCVLPPPPPRRCAFQSPAPSLLMRYNHPGPPRHCRRRRSRTEAAAGPAAQHRKRACGAAGRYIGDVPNTTRTAAAGSPHVAPALFFPLCGKLTNALRILAIQH
jgi:hypothetical protein